MRQLYQKTKATKRKNKDKYEKITSTEYCRIIAELLGAAQNDIEKPNKEEVNRPQQ